MPPSDFSDPLYFTINNDTPNPLETTCKICGRSFHTNRNLKIHFSHKHKHQTQAQSTSNKHQTQSLATDSGRVELTADALAAERMENSHEQLRALLREKHLYLQDTQHAKLATSYT